MITEFLNEYHLLGIALGLCTFFVIGLFHPIVIKSEYHFGVKCWWVFLVAGIVMCILAWWITDVFWSVLAAVCGFSCFWSILEVFEQRERVRKGWFPKKPGKEDAK